MSHRKKTILIVDDEPGMIATLGRIFRSRGYQVVPATSGAEALAREGDPPDLLLTDIRMPGMDGLELARRLREKHPDIVVMFMTAYAQSEQVSLAVEEGACSVFSKPFQMEEVLTQIQLIFRQTPILILDDDLQFSSSLERVLQREGFSVLTTDQLARCRQLVSATPNLILLLDLRLNGVTGLDALRELNQEFPQVRAILITGFPELLEEVKPTEQPGLQGCFQKPIDIPQLLEVLCGLQS